MFTGLRRYIRRSNGLFRASCAVSVAIPLSLACAAGQDDVIHPALAVRPIAEVPAPSLALGSALKGRANMLYPIGLLSTPGPTLSILDSLVPGEIVKSGITMPLSAAAVLPGKVSMKAAIIEQDQQSIESPKITFGNAVWTMESDPTPTVRVSTEFASAGLRATITFQSRNASDASPLYMRIYASSTDARTFQVPLIRELPRSRRFGSADGDSIGINLQPGGPNEWIVPILRPDGPVDIPLALLLERPWIDVPLASRNGKKFVLTFEKGAQVNAALRTLLANTTIPERPAQ